MRIINIICPNLLIEHFYSFFLIIRNETGGKSNLFQSPKQFFCSVICRCTVRHKSIIYIKNYSSITLFIQSFKWDYICRYHIFIREKSFKHYFSSNSISLVISSSQICNIVFPSVRITTSAASSYFSFLFSINCAINSTLLFSFKSGRSLLSFTRS